MQVTIDLPDDLANRLAPERDHLGEIIERGLRRRWSETTGLGHEVIAFLAGGPHPREIVAFRPPQDVVERSRELLERSREGTLTAAERAELDELAALDSFVSLVKAEARLHLATNGT